MKQRPTILIVDDELDDARVVWGGPLVTDYGWNVAYAGGYREAIIIMEASPPDVVLIDRRMQDPKTGELGEQVGDRLLEEVVARWPNVCPIMLTHNADYLSAKRDTRKGAYEYFDKRVEHKDLDAACRRGRRWVQIKLCRGKFLWLQSLEEILAAAASAFSLGDDLYCLAFVELTATGAFLLRRLTCNDHPRDETRFIVSDKSQRNDLLEVIASRRVCVKDSKQLKTSAAISQVAAVQVIAPIVGYPQLGRPVEDQVFGLLWIEGKLQDSLNHEDAEMAGVLANYVAEAMGQIRKDRKVRLDSREDTSKWLLATTAREICVPLQAAQTDLELLHTRITSSGSKQSAQEFAPQVMRVAQYLEDAVQAAVELRNDLRDAELHVHSLNLLEIVRDRCESFRSRALAGNCVIDPKPDGWPALTLNVALDRVQMRYALDCLLENAIEAIEEQRRRKGDPDIEGRIVVRIAMDSEKREALLSIVDNGCGIDREYLPKVFDRYFTTKESTLRDGNTSMGLSQVKRFVEACGGEIEACNAPKGGAEFTLLFPVVASNESSI